MKTNVPKPVPPAYMAQQPVGTTGPTSNTAQPTMGFSASPASAMSQAAAPTRKRSLIGGAA